MLMKTICIPIFYSICYGKLYGKHEVVNDYKGQIHLGRAATSVPYKSSLNILCHIRLITDIQM